MENRQNTKKNNFFKKLWKKPEILMVLQRYNSIKLIEIYNLKFATLISHCFSVAL